MPSPSSEAGRAYAVAREEQRDAASQCPVAASRKCVVPDGMRPAAAAYERGKYVCFGRGRSGAVCWRSPAKPIVTTCAA